MRTLGRCNRREVASTEVVDESKAVQPQISLRPETMSQTRQGFLHYRGGDVKQVELPEREVPAVVRPAQIFDLDTQWVPGTIPKHIEYGERLFRIGTSKPDGTHYVQDRRMPEPGNAATTMPRPRCHDCGEAANTLFVLTLAKTEELRPGTKRLCQTCYDRS